MDDVEQDEATFALALADLEQALGLLALGIARHPLVAMLEGVLLEAGASEREVVLRTTDLDTHVEVRLPAECARGRLLLSHRGLKANASALRKGRRGPRTARIAGRDGGAAAVSVGEESAPVTAYRSADFPTMRAPAPPLAEVDRAAFAASVVRVAGAAVKLDERPGLRAVRLGPEHERLRVAASDLFRLACEWLPATTDPQTVAAVASTGEGAPGVPADLLERLVRRLRGERVLIGGRAGGEASFSCGGVTVVTPCVDQGDVTGMRIPLGTLRVEVEREALLADVERCAGMVEAFAVPSSGVRLVVVDEQGVVALPEHRRRWDEVRVPGGDGCVTEERRSVVCNPDGLARALRAFDGERVVLRLRESGEIGAIGIAEPEVDRDFESGGFRYLVMTIKARRDRGPGRVSQVGDGAAAEGALVECEHGPLLDALEAVAGMVEPKGEGASARVGLAAAEDHVLVTAGHDRGSVQVRMRASWARGRLEVEHGELLGLLRASGRDLPEHERRGLSVRVVETGPEAARLETRGYQLPLVAHPPAERPAPELPGAIAVDVAATDLLRGVERVCEAAWTRPRERQELFGVRLELGRGRLTLASTDGGRLAVAPMEAVGGPETGVREGVLDVDVLHRFVAHLGGERVSVGWAERGGWPQLSLRSGGTALVAASASLHFVGYDHLLERPVAGSMVVDRRQLLREVKRACALSKGSAAEAVVALCTTPEGVSVGAVTGEGAIVGARAVEAVVRDVSAGQVTWYIGARLSSALAAFDEPQVAVHLEADGKGLRLTRVADRVDDALAFRYLVAWAVPRSR